MTGQNEAQSLWLLMNREYDHKETLRYSMQQSSAVLVSDQSHTAWIINYIQYNPWDEIT